MTELIYLIIWSQVKKIIWRLFIIQRIREYKAPDSMLYPYNNTLYILCKIIPLISYVKNINYKYAITLTD